MQVLAFPVLSASLEHCSKQADRLAHCGHTRHTRQPGCERVTRSPLLPFPIKGLHPELLLEDIEKIKSLWHEDTFFGSIIAHSTL